MAHVLATPGVYIDEKSAFPNSAVPVATAVPAFIGYTADATRDKKSILNQPIRISSFGEYLLYFGGPPPTKYTLTKAAAPKFYELATVAASRFMLYYSMKFFFANGGSDCYIVSIGDYSKAPALADFHGVDETTKMPKGIDTLKKEPEPTMLVIPDAIRLTAEACGTLQGLMLAHCQELASRFAVLDVHMDEDMTTKPITRDLVTAYRTNVGNNALQWGAAYYPLLVTNITGSESISYKSLDKVDSLVEILKEEVTKNQTDGAIKEDRAKDINTEIDRLTDEKADANSLHQTLLAVSPMYKAIMGSILEKINLLPPSAGMAGIYSMVDNNIGVFQSPANVSIGSVIKPWVSISHEEQQDLNLPLTGKAVNAIRTFPGKGVLVWGARTLDGNSQDWRYISVRRTVIYIEQSIKYATEPYVFAPNTSGTWTNIKAMITNFLTNVWQAGALAGAKPEDAFTVDVGLGTTMTPVDILDGILRVTVKIAVTRPAEFIVITFQQKMQQS